MTRDDRRYARFYYPEFIRDYSDIYYTDAAFATWMRLLVLAEQMWPMPVELPRSVRPKALAVLTDAGLITTNGTYYTVKGLDVERTSRRNAARKGAAERWDNERNANALPSPSTSKDEQKLPPPPAKRGRRKTGTNPRAQGTAPRQNGTAPRDLGESPRQQKRSTPTLAGNVLAEMAKGLGR
jgi:hypothetical protein